MASFVVVGQAPNRVSIFQMDHGSGSEPVRLLTEDPETELSFLQARAVARALLAASTGHLSQQLNAVKVTPDE